ncbi:MAG: hypothetical protein J6J24_01215 [Clostridia bacterium]|nr:hypothetical protein [Clostridia bacterium]
MNIAQIIKNQDFFKKIVEKKENNSLANAMLFFCEDDITSKKVLVLTAMLLEYQMFDMYDDQSSEFKKIEAGIDLDVKVYPKNGEKLLVADSNEIVSESFVKPVNLPYKIFIINNFDVSTEEAQNKLLKILEEPPKNVFFLLSAKSEERVLPTIKSRCDKIKIQPLSNEEISLYCQNSLANILGGGWIGKTLELSNNENLKSLTYLAVSLICELKNSKQVLSFSNKVATQKENLNLILEIVSLCLEDIIKIKCDSENLCKLKLFMEELRDVEPEFSVEAICEITKLIANLQEKLEFNANLSVTLDNFLLKMLEVKFICK